MKINCSSDPIQHIGQRGWRVWFRRKTKWKLRSSLMYSPEGVAGFDSKARQVEVKILFDILARGAGIFDLSGRSMEIQIPVNILATGGDGFDSEKEEVKAQILCNALTRGVGGSKLYSVTNRNGFRNLSSETYTIVFGNL